MILGIDIANQYLAKFDNNYKDYHDLPEDKYISFINMYLNEIVTNNILKEGVKEAFTYFNNHGFKIIIITARNNKYTPSIKELTKEFLDTKGLKYDKLIFDDTAIGDKSKAAFENKIDIFIDDKEVVLDQISTINKDIECIRFTSDRTSKYQTFNNWYDLLEYIKTK